MLPALLVVEAMVGAMGVKAGVVVRVGGRGWGAAQPP